MQNYPIPGELVAVEARPYAERPHLIAYSGGISVERGIREMIRAVALLPQSLDARLFLAGIFLPQQLESEVRQMAGWDRVTFEGWLSRCDLRQLLARARVGLVLFHPAPNHINAQPNKLFEYMSAGIPVLASDFPLWREIVEGSECGLLVDPLDAGAIADELEWLLRHPDEAQAMGERGQQAVLTRYNWDYEGQKLLDLYRDLCSDSKQSGAPTPDCRA